MNREVLRLAVPNVLSNVSVPLLSTVDTALMGHLSASHLAAVGLASMLFNFLYWNLGFLRMGTTGLTAQAFGAQDRPLQTAVLARAGALALGLALLLVVFQHPLYALADFFLGVRDGQQALVQEYFNIRIWAAPASLLLYVLTGWLFGQQNARYPLYIALFANVVNIGLSYGLVVGLGWGIAGVAYGTVMAQYAALSLALGLLTFRYRSLLVGLLRHLRSSWESYLRLLQVNGDIFLRTLCLTLAFGFLYNRAAADSVLALATVTVLMQFLNWMSYAIDGFAYAAEAMVGKYTGAKDDSQAKRAIRLAMAYGAGLALVFALTYGFAGNWLVTLFTSDADVQQATQQLIGYLIMLPLVGTACYIWDGVLVGLTATRTMRDTMALSLVVFLGGYYLLRNAVSELDALWLALLLFLAARGIFQTVWFSRKGLALR